MNYLAHIALSGSSGAVQIGNFIGDFVKGKAYQNYPRAVKSGILLHREIDHFTDNHPVVKECVAELKPYFGRYSAIVLDLYFDYFLANAVGTYFSKRTLNGISFRFYCNAVWYYFILPPKVKNFIGHFIFTNRLRKYRSKEGLQNSLQIMFHYKTPQISPTKAIDVLELKEQLLRHKFEQFFPDLLSFVAGSDVLAKK